MKIYLFYKMIHGLEPTLYAFTNKKDLADLFNSARSSMYLKTMNMNETQWSYMMSKHSMNKLEPHRLKTRSKDGIGTMKVLQVMTTEEIMRICLHKEDIFIEEASKNIFPIEIFSKDIQKDLRKVLYDYVVQMSALPFWESHNKERMNIDWEIDELGLFIALYRDTLKM